MRPPVFLRMPYRVVTSSHLMQRDVVDVLPPVRLWVRHVSVMPPPPPLPGKRLPPPPRIPGSSKLPPPPPLMNPASGGSSSVPVALPWKSPQEVLSALVEFIPTFYVPVHCVAAILSEETRSHFLGRNKFISFLRRYRFFFDIRILDSGSRCDVKLREDVNHPRRGVADDKFILTDIGEVANYVANPDYIVSIESIDINGAYGVALKPHSAPPAVHVQLEERVPVVDRLRALIPADFVSIDVLETEIPEDVLFHPYFDCQGGLTSIASKFPEHFQVVEGAIRLRPPHLAPLALNDYTLDNSPLPEVAELVRREVCQSDIPHWVSATSLYEQLTREQKRQIKRDFRSFAGFLRAHGKALSISQDMLQVAMWISPQNHTHQSQNDASTLISCPSSTEPAHTTNTPATQLSTSVSLESAQQAGGVRLHFTQTQVINELFDRFPPFRTLNANEVLELIPSAMRYSSVPKKFIQWLASFPNYFVVENPTEEDTSQVRVRRASDRQPLDLALAVYQYIHGKAETPVAELMANLPDVHRTLISRLGVEHVANMLPEWLTLWRSSAEDPEKPSTIYIKCRRTLQELEEAIRKEQTKLESQHRIAEQEEMSLSLQSDERWLRSPKYEGGMSQASLRSETSQTKPSP